MNGVEWLEKLMACEEAKAKIPLELQVTMPLWLGGNRAACWYYRLMRTEDGPAMNAPSLRVVWDTETMRVVEKQSLAAEPIGACPQLLTRQQREREDQYLNGCFQTAMQNHETSETRHREQWLEALPAPMRDWMENHSQSIIDKERKS